MKNSLASVLLGLWCGGALHAQNLCNDTIALNASTTVTLVFPSEPNANINDGDGTYLAKRGGGSKSLLLVVRKDDAPPQVLIVTEGGREHRFLMVCRERVERLRYEWKMKDIKRSAEQRKQIVNAKLGEAKQLFDAGNYEEAEAAYRWLLQQCLYGSTADEVTARVRDCENQNLGRRRDCFRKALERGDKAASARLYFVADSAYTAALNCGFADSMAKQKKTLNRTAWVKSLPGDIAIAAKAENFRLATAKCDTLEQLDTRQYLAEKYPKKREGFQQKWRKQLYNVQVKRADSAFAAKELYSSLAAFDSALVLVPKDSYSTKRRKVVVDAINELMPDNEIIAKYYTLLMKARNQVREAKTKADYDAAIATYEEAKELRPARYFARGKIKELETKKASLATH